MSCQTAAWKTGNGQHPSIQLNSWVQALYVPSIAKNQRRGAQGKSFFHTYASTCIECLYQTLQSEPLHSKFSDRFPSQLHSHNEILTRLLSYSRICCWYIPYSEIEHENRIVLSSSFDEFEIYIRESPGRRSQKSLKTENGLIIFIKLIITRHPQFSIYLFSFFVCLSLFLVYHLFVINNS